jgi:CxxC motif-containing protein (DUF1111 family)
MKKNYTLLVLVVLAIIIIGCKKLVPEAPMASDTIAEPTEGLTPAQTVLFVQGDELFAKVFTPEEGAGPIFIQTSCEGCHVGDGKGHPFNTVTRFGKQTDTGFDYMLEFGGPQIQQRAIPGFLAETLPKGYTHKSDRIAPIVIGMGFLDAVTDQTILDMADSTDADGDGVSGRVNYVKPRDYFTAKSTHIPNADGNYIGRFGKKAKEISLRAQVVFALKEDIGLTSDFDTEDLFNYSVAGNISDDVADPEVGSNVVERLVFYMRTLKAPTRRNEDDADVIAGAEVFSKIGCESCHKSTLVTGPSEIEALNYKTFHPYTDLLLHDMGPDLGDGVPEGDATGNEWRTPPLWGLGLAEDSQGGTGYYMHDGRATSLEEAIEMHTQGEAASIAVQYFVLPDAEKEQLMKFLKSL